MTRGDLLSRAHDEGEVLTVEHGGDGTELTAKVPLGLAAELDRFVQDEYGSLGRSPTLLTIARNSFCNCVDAHGKPV